MFPEIHSPELLTIWQEPCVIFCPHWSLRLGPVVHLLRRWCANPDSLLIMEEGIDLELGVLPFKPMEVKVLKCSFISGINVKKAPYLLEALQPMHVVLPEDLRPHFSHLNHTYSLSYFSENETLVIPKLKKQGSELSIAVDLASQLLCCAKSPLGKDGKEFVRLKGELSMERGKYQLVIGNDRAPSSSQSRPVVCWGRIDPEALVAALGNTGIKATVEQSQPSSSSSTTTKSMIHISEPSEASIEVSTEKTLISAADEDFALRISESICTLLKCI